MLDIKFLQKIKMEVVMRYRKHIFDPGGSGTGARDVHGKKYKDYVDPEYKFKKLEYQNSTAPVLSGKLLNDFQFIKVTDTEIVFGTRDWGSTVASLRRMGREISTKSKPLPDSVEKYIMDEAFKYAKKDWKKIKDRTIII